MITSKDYQAIFVDQLGKRKQHETNDAEKNE